MARRRGRCLARRAFARGLPRFFHRERNGLPRLLRLVAGARRPAPLRARRSGRALHAQLEPPRRVRAARSRRHPKERAQKALRTMPRAQSRDGAHSAEHEAKSSPGLSGKARRHAERAARCASHVEQVDAACARRELAARSRDARAPGRSRATIFSSCAACPREVETASSFPRSTCMSAGSASASSDRTAQARRRFCTSCSGNASPPPAASFVERSHRLDRSRRSRLDAR